MIGVQRRPQLVGHVGQELGLVLAGDFELAALVLDLPEQPRVLDGQGRLGGEGPEQLDDLRREVAGRFRITARPPMQPSSRTSGTASSARYPDSIRCVPQRGSRRRRAPDVGDLDRLAASRRVRPTAPSPLRIGVASSIGSTSSASRCSVARGTNSSRGLVVLVDRRRRRRPTAGRPARRSSSSTVSRSSVELTACPTSPSAVSCSTERVSSPVRACSSLNRRTFSIGDHRLVGEGLEQARSACR